MKFKTTLVLLMLISVAAIAQTPQSSTSNGHSIEMRKKEIQAFKHYNLTELNRPKLVTSPFKDDSTSGAVTNNSNRTTSDFEPYAQIDVLRWGVINKVENGGEILYSSERIGNNYTVKTYNDDIEIVDDFTIEVPESANQIEVVNHYSSNFFNADSNKEFMIFLHYFEGVDPGPDDQVWEVWVVNEEGEILQQLDGYAAETKIDAAGNHKVFTYMADDNDVTIRAFNAATWELDNSYVYDSELINFLMGSPFNFITIDGVEYVALAHYKHLFMDNATLEVFPDNNLVIKLLDLNLEEVKTMYLDIETRYPDAGQFVIPMGQFGVFYRDQTYDISSDIFNSDSKLEVVYGITYYDMIADNEWNTYMVANEDGEMIHELNEYIIDSFMELNSVDGHDNQLGFLMGADGVATNLGFFNIESWSFELILDANHNGDQISADFNRIQKGYSYNYLVGLGEPDEENGNIFGVVNEYERDGSLFKRHRFILPGDVVLFQPILTRFALIPNLFVDDSELYFMYIYKQMAADGSNFNNLVVSKSNEDKLVEFRGDTGIGNVIGSSFLTDGNGVFNKMTVQYETGNNQMQTDFYRLPFESILGVENNVVTQFSLYPNPTSEVLNVNAGVSIESIQIYNISGNLLKNKSMKDTQGSINVSSLSSGLYIAKVTLNNGTLKQLKFIKK
ncbi:T9SS type A sorting domain-containing protein [Aequorivita xiaoshiensis]|uniref:T9SS type A sorting domain-containing protein n=1 Tax=Aequorivita xiaoshiensis TaxID=2874476 RepID=A0A9X1R0E7_9FLAO|nr:T9SS type A sorting domain-containing protein [Aequorivita xiaoshiensis]MCG2432051.1 T9SS type A sorting domain-containing protein [Aequorivita xiaoshiensis]